MSDSPQSLCDQLRAEVFSVHLATVGENGEPHTACVPYLWMEQGPHIFVSKLSVHTRDLLAKPAVSAMIVEDETGCRQPFARIRLRYQCRARAIEREDPSYQSRLDAFQSKHGNTVKLLRTLSDFVLFELVPAEATFVMGFGQAFKLSGPNWDQFEHVKTG